MVILTVFLTVENFGLANATVLIATFAQVSKQALIMINLCTGPIICFFSAFTFTQDLIVLFDSIVTVFSSTLLCPLALLSFPPLP